MPAREVAPVTPGEFAERLGETRFAPLIRARLELFASVAAVIHTRNLAFCTQQTYMNWMCRIKGSELLIHSKGTDPFCCL